MSRRIRFSFHHAASSVLAPRPPIMLANLIAINKKAFSLDKGESVEFRRIIQVYKLP